MRKKRTKKVLEKLSYLIATWIVIKTHLVQQTVSETVRFVKHIAAKHFNAGICSTEYRVVIKRANNGIAPAWDNIFWSFELWHIGTKIFATHAWHWIVFSGDAKPRILRNILDH